MKNFLGIVSVCVGLIALACMFIPFERIQRDFVKKPENHLKAAIPTNIGEMTSKDIPLSESEELARVTESILHVNEYLNRTYRLPDGTEFSLYISYWEPNMKDLSKASEHTPDRCWVKNGWKNIEEKKRLNDVLETDGKKLFPAYYRELSFDAGGGRIFKRNVWFWFIADGERHTYLNKNDTYSVSPLAYLIYSVRDALKGSPEQYFVRIDSDAPLESIYEIKEFKELLHCLGDLILFDKKANAASENQPKSEGSKKGDA